MRIRKSHRLALVASLAVFAVAGFAGCGSDNDVAKGPTGPEWQEVTGQVGSTGSSEPPPIQVLTGDDTGIHVVKPTVIVAQTKAQRTNLLKRQFSNGVEPQRVVPSDFRTQQLVGLFLPESPRGTIVVITDVHQEGDHIVVNAVRLGRGDGCGAPPVKPRPFHIVETRRMKTDGAAVIQVKSQKGDACTRAK